MCGICGIFYPDPRRHAERDTLAAMNSQIVHRGPDDDGFFVCGQVGLAMRRLSIIDLETGHQPISNEDHRLWIVYNGEIYNHQQLRAELQARGHQYRTRSDTETILHLYEEYGAECVKHLRGMFAFAIWDARRRRLFIARDRLGIKPLYYHLSPGQIAWGSEIKVVLSCPGTGAQFDRTVLPEYLAFGYLSGEQTFYSGIHKLMPGHWMEIDPSGQVKIERYWDLPVTPSERAQPESYYAQTSGERLEKPGSSHLR